ncbi:class I SAM-dependent methyltransferase, partial [Xanthomonas citri pv. citri]
MIFLATALLMLWGSKFGKLALRDKILNGLSWRGDERVLDIGCGHGLMLLGAAKRLTTGKATGIDLWQNQDQANNSADAARENARRENVTGRVDLVDGDARALPFPDNAFDVILSSWAIHNIYEAAGREKAVMEAARTLKPGGQMALT